MVVTDQLRDGCAEVSRRARYVRVEEAQIALYAVSLPDPRAASQGPGPSSRDRALLAAHWVTLDAINFGSGWFPTLRKRPGRSGYATVAAGVARRFEQQGPWPAAELERITAAEIAAVLEQDPGHELMGLFAASLRDLGAHLQADFNGSALALAESAQGSAVSLIETVADWHSFADSSHYDELELPFLKRAQILAADLQRAGAASFGDMAELTLFADNLVPHVLRLDGVLTFDPALVARIEAGQVIEHGTREEVEIRACALHAVELIAAASPRLVTAAELDQLLWNRGQGRAYKARPRHRSRSTAY